MERNFSDVICEEVSILEGIFGDENLATTSVRKLSTLEGIFSVVIFTDGYEHCDYIEDTGVESVKGMSMFDSLW